jgi:hypothetical protein
LSLARPAGDTRSAGSADPPGGPAEL